MAFDQVGQVLKRIAAMEGPCQHVVLAFSWRRLVAGLVGTVRAGRFACCLGP